MSALELKAYVFSVQGVGTWRNSSVLEIIDYWDPHREDGVVIAFDQDDTAQVRATVQRQADELATALGTMGFSVEFATW